MGGEKWERLEEVIKMRGDGREEKEAKRREKGNGGMER